MTTPKQVRALSQEQAIAAIYETVIRSELCDRFGRPFLNLAVEISETAPVLQSRPCQCEPGYRMHFARANEILEQLWVRSGRPEPTQFFEGSDNYWVLMTGAGTVSRASRTARDTWHGTEGAAPDCLDLDSASQARISKFLAQLAHHSGEASFEILPTQDPFRKLMCRVVQWGEGVQASHGLMIEALDFFWSSSAGEVLSATFGLHQQEVQLLASLLNGKSLRELREFASDDADDYSMILQAIVAKSGAPDPTAMFRLFCFLIAEVNADDRIAKGETTPPEGQVQMPDGTCMQYFKLGAETGQSVIFLHGLVDGIAGVQRLQSQFRASGFRVYAPMRGGYGESGPVPSIESGIGVFIDQLEALIERENLQRPILLGHRGGAAFAHIAARRLRDRVSGAVIVSGLSPVQ